MIGIYKITNLVNNKVYIGQSIHILDRLAQHWRTAFNNNHHCYNYPLYRAIRKYGIENFKYDILEETSVEQLTIREQYWIDYYNSLNPNYGYNLIPAIDPHKGENCNFALLDQKSVEKIILLIQNTNMLFNEIGELFDVSGSCIEDINKGRRWAQSNLCYPLRTNNKSLAHRGEKQNTAKLSEADVLTIRQRYVNESLPQIYENYKHLIGFSGFKKICYGVTWKHLPCYKKRQGIWDYPI